MTLQVSCDTCGAVVPETDSSEWIVVIDGGTHHFCSWAHARDFTALQASQH